MKLTPVIGLEIHVQLKTISKMFCACDNTGENQPANTTICPVCLAHPGTLPIPNRTAIELGVKAALALNLQINLHSKFDRKNYFYPDLPKGYQISQYDEPLAQNGFLDIQVDGETRRVGLERLHLEEDTAKLLHVAGKSLVDFNRAGTPLAEIVTKPEITSPTEAKLFLQELRLIMRTLGVSDADMEKGHLRCDANISLRPEGDSKFYPKTEIKNLNSFRSVEKALTYEIERQTKLWAEGGAPQITSTRGWDDKKGITVLQRTKEAIHDYRYFPEPDIPPLEITSEQIEAWRASLPELPSVKRSRLINEFGLSPKEAELLLDDENLGCLVGKVSTELAPELEGDVKAASKLTFNWLANKLTAILREKNLSLEQVDFDTKKLVNFLLLIARRQVNSTNGQVLLRKMIETGKEPLQIIADDDLGQNETGDLETVVSDVIAQFPDQVAQFKAGKEPVIKFLLGAVIKATRGKVDPISVEEVLREMLK